jgi:hypothetical protein
MVARFPIKTLVLWAWCNAKDEPENICRACGGVNMHKDGALTPWSMISPPSYRGTLAIDELVLRPREALRFCDDVRRQHGSVDLPGDAIPRWLMNRAKDS